MKEEAESGDGDPAFPKAPWPPATLCPKCRRPALTDTGDVQWNEDEVYRFLLTYYGASDAALVVSSKGRFSRSGLPPPF